MWVSRDEADHRPTSVPFFDKAPERGRQGVAVGFAQGLYELEAWLGRGRFHDKARCKEENLASGIVGFRLNDFMTGRRERLLGIAKHHVRVPGYDVVADLVCLV